MSAEYQRLVLEYQDLLKKNAEDNKKALQAFVDRTWAEKLNDPQIKSDARETRAAWLLTVQNDPRYIKEEERLNSEHQEIIAARDANLTVQRLTDVKRNRIAENLKYSLDHLPLGGDWVTFLNEPGEKIEVPWVQNGYLKFATYYKTTCWFGKLMLYKPDAPQTLPAATLDPDAPFFYHHERQLKNWQALKAFDLKLAYFNSQGETDIFIASEFVDEAYAEGSHVWGLHRYHLKNRAVKKDAKFAMIRLQDDMQYGQDAATPMVRWLVYHPFRTARTIFQHQICSTLKKEYSLASASAAENIQVGNVLGPWGKLLEAGGKGVGQIIKLLAKNVGHSLHRFDILKPDDSPYWNYRGNSTLPQAPKAEPAQDYVPDAGNAPTTEEAVADIFDVVEKEIVLEKKVTALREALTDGDPKANDKTAAQMLQLFGDIGQNLNETQEQRPGDGESQLSLTQELREVIRKQRFIVRKGRVYVPSQNETASPPDPNAKDIKEESQKRSTDTRNELNNARGNAQKDYNTTAKAEKEEKQK